MLCFCFACSLRLCRRICIRIYPYMDVVYSFLWLAIGTTWVANYLISLVCMFYIRPQWANIVWTNEILRKLCAHFSQKPKCFWQKRKQGEARISIVFSESSWFYMTWDKHVVFALKKSTAHSYTYMVNRIDRTEKTKKYVQANIPGTESTENEVICSCAISITYNVESEVSYFAHAHKWLMLQLGFYGNG